MKRTRLRRVSNRQLVIIECDKILRQILLIQRRTICEWCEKTRPLQVSHILSKGLYPKLRFHKMNLLMLCVDCHLFKWHKSPLDATAFLNKYKGEDYIDKLKAINVIQPKLTPQYLQTLKHALRVELRQLQEFS